jgi:hypothetical protein
MTEFDQGPVGISIDARISGSGSLYRGHLRLMETNSPVVERDVGGANCVDVTAALALITAVSLDAARNGPQPDVSVMARQKENAKRWALGSLAGIDTVIAPSVVPTFGLSLTYHDRRRVGSPEYRVAGLFALSGWEPVSPGGQRVGDARFSWFASRSTACPFQFQWASTTIGPCASLEIGVLRGEGRIRDGVQSGTGLWLAPGASLNWSVQLDPVWLRLAAGGTIPVTRDKFQFTPNPPNPVAFQPPAAGLSAELELAWAFR